MGEQTWRTKRVLDWEGQPVGQVRSVVVNARTGSPRALIVGLSPEARARLHTEALVVSFPVAQVAGLRPTEVVLSRRMDDLARDFRRARGGMPPAL